MEPTIPRKKMGKTRLFTCVDIFAQQYIEEAKCLIAPLHQQPNYLIINVNYIIIFMNSKRCDFCLTLLKVLKLKFIFEKQDTLTN